MVPPRHRLTSSQDFSVTVRSGQRAGTNRLVVHLYERDVRSSDGSNRIPDTRVGFVVSKAVGGAVVRNKVTRRLRHLTRERLAGLPAGADVVVRARPAAATATYGELGADLDVTLRRATAKAGR